MQNTKLHNGTKRKKRRHRFLFGVLLSALLITGALYGREYDISQLKNIEVMETLSSAVSQFGDRKLPVYSVQTTEKKIALSFDCAWGAEDFDSMMETLDKHNVKATFFMTGGFVSDNPECVKTLVEKGHEPGNHSEHHYDMATITAGEMKTEIMDVHKKVKELTGKDMKVFRPPYGSYNNEHQRRSCERRGVHRCCKHRRTEAQGARHRFAADERPGDQSQTRHRGGSEEEAARHPSEGITTQKLHSASQLFLFCIFTMKSTVSQRRANDRRAAYVS